LSGFARAFVLGLVDIDRPEPQSARQRPLHQIVADFERTVLEDALRLCRGDMTRLQDLLQTPRKTIYDKLAKYDLKPAQYR
jgi:two-component system, NtrC family, C4-dicarboxylate transport response regulator DctD